ncbi:MAG: STAS domain-containing protein [Fluviibacter sp.]
MATVQLTANGKRLEIKGDMTAQDVPDLLASVRHYTGIEQIDLAGVGRVDSSALTVLLACSRASHGATVSVHQAPPALRALSDLYGLQTLFWVV